MLIVIKFVTLFSGRSSSRIPEQFENQQKCPTVSTINTEDNYRHFPIYSVEHVHLKVKNSSTHSNPLVWGMFAYPSDTE